MEDIDKLLDEADMMTQSIPRERVKKPQSELSHQISSLLSELDQCEADEEEEVVVARGEPQSQCWPLLVGGSLSSSGLSSLSRPRTCDRLLCLSCNLSVISVQNMAWTPDTDYMFLRNSVPNMELLRSRLVSRPGCRAYACHCHWSNVTDTGSVKELQLPWICRKH